MFGSLLSLLVASAAVTVALPATNLPHGNSDDALFHILKGRGILGPISTESPAGISGGQVASGAPPLSSFFAGLKAPVRRVSGNQNKSDLYIVPNKYVVGLICSLSWKWYCCWSIPIRVRSTQQWCCVWYQRQSGIR
jgi:hypothetical protein